jgi:hypothetical protein
MPNARTIGTLAIALGAAAAPASAQISFYLGEHRYTYVQAGAAAPAPAEFIFAAIIAAAPGEIGTATVTPAALAPVTLTDDGTGFFTRTDSFTSEGQLLAQYPPGVYTFNVAGGKLGALSGQLTQPDPLPLPDNVPTFDQATMTAFSTGVDPAQPLTIAFNTFTSPAPFAAATLVITRRTNGQVVFSSDLGIGQTSVTVPASTLPAARRLNARLAFSGFNRLPFAGLGGADSLVIASRLTEALIITQPVCVSDWNEDGVTDFNDFLAFVNDYNAQLPRADLNDDGSVDFNDLLEFLNEFNTPC